MLYSKAFIHTSKDAPKDADNISSALLIRAGFIDKLASGIYSFLPLGKIVSDKICQIIRKNLNEIGAQELILPVMQPREIWEETGRWQTIDPPLFKFKNRHEKEFALGPTHEEVLVDIVRDRIFSWQDLPQNLYQIQTKFRNEQRATSGLLRTREFLMLDSYSFHTTQEDLKKHYAEVTDAFRKIFDECGLKPILTRASSGTIGGSISHEFILLTEVGEDRIYLCGKCGFAANSEIFKDKKCPECGSDLKEERGIELAHIFLLGDLYSKKMGANFADKNNQKKPIIMGCYGIGVGRLLAAVLEKYHDEKGMMWPVNLAPYSLYLIDLSSSKKGEEIYKNLQDQNYQILFDDREVSAGVKFADSDLLGFPIRLVVSDKTLEEDSVEIKLRGQEATELVKINELGGKIKDILRGASNA